MTESAKIVLHMSRLAEHVRRRLQTTDVYWWMYSGTYPNDGNYAADVREALAKLQQLAYRYDQIWKRSNRGLRTDTSGQDPESIIRLHDYCCDFERKWVLSLWRKGDWYVVKEDCDGRRRILRAFCEGKYRWYLN